MSDALIPGRYKVRCPDPGAVQFGFTSSGAEQVAVPLVIVDGPCLGVEIPWFGNFSEKGTEIAIKALRALGWHGDNLADLSGIDSQDAEAVIDLDTYDKGDGSPPVTRLKVKWINAPGSGRVKLSNQMDDAQRIAFAQRMKGTVISMRQAQPAAPAPKREPRFDSMPTARANHAKTPASKSAAPVDVEAGGFDAVPF